MPLLIRNVCMKCVLRRNIFSLFPLLLAAVQFQFGCIVLNPQSELFYRLVLKEYQFRRCLLFDDRCNN